MTTEYIAPEGATHQHLRIPCLFYRAGPDGKVICRYAFNHCPTDIWEMSGYGGNDALEDATVFRPLAEMNKPKEYAPGVWHEWAGGECPIPAGRRFCYVMRDNPKKPYQAVSNRHDYVWEHDGIQDITKFWLGSCLDEARAALTIASETGAHKEKTE